MGNVLKLSKELLNKLRKFSENLGLNESDVAEVLLESFLMRKEYFKNALRGYAEKLDVLREKCFLIVDYGTHLLYLFGSLARMLGLNKDELILMDIDFLKDMKGL